MVDCLSTFTFASSDGSSWKRNGMQDGAFTAQKKLKQIKDSKRRQMLRSPFRCHLKLFLMDYIFLCINVSRRGEAAFKSNLVWKKENTENVLCPSQSYREDLIYSAFTLQVISLDMAKLQELKWKKRKKNKTQSPCQGEVGVESNEAIRVLQFK